MIADADHLAGSQRVLVVDDDPLNLLLLATMLQVFGCQIDQANSGAEAWAMLQDQAFDRVLLDVHMPGLSGIELAARLRGSGGPNHQVPMVAVSGDTVITPKQYRQLGFDGFLEKPISFGALRLSLAICRQSSERAAQA